VPIIRDYRSKIASNSFTGKVNTRDFSALCLRVLSWVPAKINEVKFFLPLFVPILKKVRNTDVQCSARGQVAAATCGLTG